MQIADRIANLNMTAAMDGPRGPEVLVLRWTPSKPVRASELFGYLTKPDLLAKWSAVVPDRALTSVGPATSHEQPDAPGVAADVIAVVPNQEVRHKWGSDDLRWRIIDGGVQEADGIRLKLEMQLEQPEFASMYAAGWQVCLGVLDSILSGDPHERIVGMDAMNFGWGALRKKYWAALPGQSDEGVF